MHFCKYFQVAASIEFENGYMCVTQNGECVDLEWRGVFIISPSKNSYFSPSTHTLGIHTNNRKSAKVPLLRSLDTHDTFARYFYLVLVTGVLKQKYILAYMRVFLIVVN